MAWQIETRNGCALVRRNTSKVNVQDTRFFGDLHAAFDRLERDCNGLPVVLTGQDNAFSAGMSDAGNRRAQDQRRQEIMHLRQAAANTKPAAQCSGAVLALRLGQHAAAQRGRQRAPPVPLREKVGNALAGVSRVPGHGLERMANTRAGAQIGGSSSPSGRRTKKRLSISTLRAVSTTMDVPWSASPAT